MFREAATRLGIEAIAQSKIVASNDINEDVLHSLNKQGHEIDVFGVGTHLVCFEIHGVKLHGAVHLCY
jgi:nicotinate phosphoribosyltransferase